MQAGSLLQEFSENRPHKHSSKEFSDETEGKHALNSNSPSTIQRNTILSSDIGIEVQSKLPLFLESGTRKKILFNYKEEINRYA